MFRPGHVGDHRRARRSRSGFQGAGLGETLRFAQRDWTVVGVFDAGRSGFDSEIWGDAEQMMQAFRRIGYLVDALPAGRHRPLRRGEGGRSRAIRACTLEAKRETQLLRRPVGGARRSSSATSAPTISIIFSIGAIIGAMITMYASVASRTGEIGTLRALGFSRAAILAAFLGEALLLGLGRRRRRPRRRVVHAGAVDLDDQLPDLRGDRVLVHADAGHRRRVAGLLAGDGIRRRLPAGGARGADEDRRRAAGGVTRAVGRYGDAGTTGSRA